MPLLKFGYLCFDKLSRCDLDLSVCASRREIIDNTGKENGIDIVMPERTYHLIAESAEDAR